MSALSSEDENCAMNETLKLEGMGPTLQGDDGHAIGPVILERIAVRMDTGECPAVLPTELELQSESFATDVLQWINKVDAGQVQFVLNARYEEYRKHPPSIASESNRLCQARWARTSCYALLAE